MERKVGEGRATAGKGDQRGLGGATESRGYCMGRKTTVSALPLLESYFFPLPRL